MHTWHCDGNTVSSVATVRGGRSAPPQGCATQLPLYRISLCSCGCTTASEGRPSSCSNIAAFSDTYSAQPAACNGRSHDLLKQSIISASSIVSKQGSSKQVPSYLHFVDEDVNTELEALPQIS